MRRILLVVPLILVVGVVAGAQSPSWLGLSISDGADTGVRVEDVVNDSPAAEGGMEVGDLIVEFDGRRVVGVRQFTRIVRETPVGRTVSVRVERDDQEQTLELTRAAQRNAGALDGLFSRNFPNVSAEIDRARDAISDIHVRINRSSSIGVRVDRMTAQLKEFFGVNPDEGMLIVSVEDDSPADAAGIRAGDVIVGLNGRRVASNADLNPGRIRQPGGSDPHDRAGGFRDRPDPRPRAVRQSSQIDRSGGFYHRESSSLPPYVVRCRIAPRTLGWSTFASDSRTSYAGHSIASVLRSDDHRRACLK